MDVRYEHVGKSFSGVDALKDGWRLFQASQILPHTRGDEFDLAYLKYEFFFEKLVEVAG